MGEADQQHAVAEYLKRAADLTTRASEAAAAGRFDEMEALEVEADQLRRRARRAASSTRPRATTTGRLSIRAMAINALAEMDVPAPAREIAVFHKARFSLPLDMRALASVRRDERKAWE